MKALKVTATVLLLVLALSAALVVQALALARGTVLDPSFYAVNGRDAYRIVGRTVVRRMAEAVLERAPEIVLRAKDREGALRLAEQALPPDRIAVMLEESGPDIARFLLYSGDIPVLKGSAEFLEGQVNIVRSMLMDGVWDLLPDKPAFPAFMPFTPEWNLGNARKLPEQLWTLRQYAGLSGYAFWLACSAVVIFSGLAYLMWARHKKPLLISAGCALTVNGLVLAALAVAASYCVPQMAESAARLYPVSLAADLVGPDWEALFRAVLRPLRDILAAWSAASLSLAAAAFTITAERRGPAAGSPLLRRLVPRVRLAGRRSPPRHSRAV